MTDLTFMFILTSAQTTKNDGKKIFNVKIQGKR